MHIEGDFERDGAVCVRGLFDADAMTEAEAAVEANLDDLSELAKRASPDDDGAFVEDFCSWNRLDAVARFALRPEPAEVVGRLTGSSAVRLYHDHMLTKEPGTKQRTPWHQDQPYYNVSGSMNASMWLPIDPVPREHSLQLIAGSHRGPWYLPRTFLDDQARWFPEGSLLELPDFDADPERWQVLTWALEPGDAVFFHFAIVHGAPGAGVGRRRVLSVRYLGDDMTFAPRPWSTSPPFPGLERELDAGDPMAHPLFPVLWRNDATSA